MKQSQKKIKSFPDGVQIAIVRYLVTSKGAIEQFAEFIKPRFFESEYYRKIYEKAHDFYKERQRLPLPYELYMLVMEHFIDMFHPEKIPVEIQVLVGDALAQVQKEEIESPEWLLEKTKAFAKFHFKKEDVLDDIHKGTDVERYKKFQETLQKIEVIGGGGLEDLDVVDIADIESEKINWLWHGRIPEGKINLIVGNPDVGKSIFTMFMTAHITTGKPWPDCPEEKVEKGKVIILTAEDGLADTVRPRILANGGKCERGEILLIRGTKVEKRLFNLNMDAGRLEALLKREGNVRLVIIDPLTAYMGRTDTYKDSDVRRVLAPFVAIAEQYKVTIVGVMHLNKKEDLSAINRITGSVAFRATARSVWLIDKDKDDDFDKRYFVPHKFNLAKKPPALEFAIVDAPAEKDIVAPKINYLGDNENVDAETLLRTPKKDKDTVKERAKKFLLERISKGTLIAGEIIEEAKANGISENALQRAREDLGIKTLKSKEADGRWVWYLEEKN